MSRPASVIFALVAFLASVGASSAQTAAAAPTVTVQSGRISGAMEGDVAAFKAIPYAAPPVGRLRWRAPEPAAAWTGVRAGDQFGPVCPQTLQKPPNDLPNQSEDCLTLNVFAPATAQAGGKLPVMVWIHGGGFTVGAGGQPFYDGAALARHGVVLVTLNYRLGRLGFFAHPALVREAGTSGLFGDYGILDQIAALTWVRANIAAFGGDPANVTVFGESAGGIAVNALMIAPAAHGLFDRAIVESGLGRDPARTLAEAEALDSQFAAALGVVGDDGKALKALRALPVSAFIPAVVSMTGADQPRPMLDGRLLSEQVADAFAAGHTAPVPLIIGTNDHEDSLYPDARRYPAKVLAMLPPNKLALAHLAYGPDDADVAGGLIVDLHFTEPARLLAHSQAATGQPVWRYRYSYVQTALRGQTPGAGHAAEVQFVFGALGLRGPQPTAEDLAVANTLQTYWTDFAKGGDPNGAGLPIWPKDTVADDETLAIGNSGVAVQHNLLKARLDGVAQGKTPPTR